MADVAQLAGVSQATASNILNGRKMPSFVTKQTQEKVRGAAQELGYRPNHFARMLRAKQSQTLGLVLPDLNSPLVSGLTAEIFELCGQQNYHVFLDLASGGKTGEAIDNLISRAVDGIFVYWPSEGLKLPKDLPLPPMVAIDTSIASDKDILVDRIEIDRFSGFCAATRQLLAEGRRRVALAVPMPLTRTAKEKMDGWRTAYSEAGVPLSSDDWVVPCGLPPKAGLSFTEGRKIADAALKSAPDMDGLLCPYWAVPGAQARFAEIGKRVPEDISLVMLNTVTTATQEPDELPAVAFPVDQIAKEGVSMLLERVQDKQQTRAPRVVKVSVECLAADDPQQRPQSA